MRSLLTVLGAAVLVAAAGIGVAAIAFQATSANAVSYYGRVDNDRVSPITPHGGMNYRYSLRVYDGDGTGSELELDTSRILKDGAFLRIETAPLRGVIRWEELEYGELPAAVQSRYEP